MLLRNKLCLSIYKIIKFERLSLILQLQALHVEARDVSSEVYLKVIANNALGD